MWLMKSYLLKTSLSLPTTKIFKFLLQNCTKYITRSSCPEVFCKKSLLKNFAIFEWWRLATLLKKRLQHRCFPVNFEKNQTTRAFCERLLPHDWLAPGIINDNFEVRNVTKIPVFIPILHLGQDIWDLFIVAQKKISFTGPKQRILNNKPIFRDASAV